MAGSLRKRHAGIVCPICTGDMAVVESIPGANYVRRRRVCDDLKCPGKLTTVEVIHPGSKHPGAKLDVGILVLPMEDIARLKRVLGWPDDEAELEEVVSPSK